MIKVLTGDQMRAVDKKTIEDLKIPCLILMENAGRAVADQVLEIAEETENENPTVLVICGKGNNGGDGFAAVRHLIQEGIETIVLSLYEKEDLSGEALTNHDVLLNFTDIVYFAEIDSDRLNDMISGVDIVVDAILGTGLKSEVKGFVADVIDAINEYSEGYVVAVDTPSGIDSNTGMVLGTAVVADYTVTFFAPKTGNVLYPGAEYAGEVIINDIGIPDFLIEDEEYNINLITSHSACVLLPIRPENSHKGSFGTVFTVGGSMGLSGAAYMSALSALKVGSGYSILATPESLIPIYASMSPEIIYTGLKETKSKALDMEAVAEALDKSEKANSFLIGPGLGTDLSTVEFVAGFIGKLTDRGLPTVIDADALNCLAQKGEFALPLTSVITPHPAELSRLLKTSVEEIQKDRIKAAREAAKQFNTIVVLKGARTVIAEPDGTVYINLTGSSALAKAGTGDVLSGMIAGYIAQGLSPKEASILSVYLHGYAGELAAEDLTEYSTTAIDVIDYIPNAIKMLI